MTEGSTFNILLLIGRPAAGKSEVIDYLKRTSIDERIRRFHIGNFTEIDDFPMLWTWFEEDALLEKMGFSRLHTDKDGYFLGNHLWNLLVQRICLEYQKMASRKPDTINETTVILEFSRGSEHGGYRAAFDNLTEDILKNLAVFYIDVSWEESLRKNRKRFNPNDPGSILQHSLPDEKLERLYKKIDWQEIRGDDPEFLEIKGIKVPYVVFENEDDVTTARGDALGRRLEGAITSLWKGYSRKPTPAG